MNKMEEDISSALDVAEQELEEKTVDSFDWLSRGSRGRLIYRSGVNEEQLH